MFGLSIISAIFVNIQVGLYEWATIHRYYTALALILLHIYQQ